MRPWSNSMWAPRASRMALRVTTSRQWGTFSSTDTSAARQAAVIIASELFLPPEIRTVPRRARPPLTMIFSMRSLRCLCVGVASSLPLFQFVFHVAAHEFFQEQQAIDLPNHRARIAVTGHIGGIAGQKIANNLIHRVIPFLAQRFVHVGKDLVDVLRGRGADPEYASPLAFIHGPSPRPPPSTPPPIEPAQFLGGISISRLGPAGPPTRRATHSPERTLFLLEERSTACTGPDLREEAILW